jgi:Ca2+-binding RTX toxin-like protein
MTNSPETTAPTCCAGTAVTMSSRAKAATIFCSAAPATTHLFGGPGNDTLVGGRGRDTLWGGDGMDQYVFNALNEGVDRINDFRTSGASADQIVFAAAIFTGFVGDDGADLVAGGFLRTFVSGGETTIQLDADGGGNAWLTIAQLSDPLTTAAVAARVIVVPDLLA